MTAKRWYEDKAKYVSMTRNENQQRILNICRVYVIKNLKILKNLSRLGKVAPVFN
jgi:hypothetical protein